MINVPLPHQLISSIDVYGMYDVFNNAFANGGKLNITLDRHFIVPKGTVGYFTDSILRRRSKYGNRDSMRDTTLRIGIVVCDSTILYRIILQTLRFIFSCQIMKGSNGLET